MFIENLVKMLEEQGLLEGLEGKRSMSGVLPVTTNIRLLIAEIASGKSRSQVLADAIAAYLEWNETDRQLEVEALAAIAGVSAEEYVAKFIEERVGRDKA